MSIRALIRRSITLPNAATLAGTATDDGLPSPPAALTYTWSKVSGPGAVTFGNASLLNTTASFSAAGSYTLRLTVSDSALSPNDEIVVSGQTAPVASLDSVSLSPTSVKGGVDGDRDA